MFAPSCVDHTLLIAASAELFMCFPEYEVPPEDEFYVSTLESRPGQFTHLHRQSHHSRCTNVVRDDTLASGRHPPPRVPFLQSSPRLLPYLTLPCLPFPSLSLPYVTLPYLTLPHLSLPLTLPCRTLPNGTLTHYILPYLTLPYLILPYQILPCLTLSYLTLPCLSLLYLTVRYLTQDEYSCAFEGGSTFSSAATYVGTLGDVGLRVEGTTSAGAWESIKVGRAGRYIPPMGRFDVYLSRPLLGD